MSTKTLSVGGRDVEISNAAKVLFPDDGITKLDLAEFYARIAETALPHYRDRPVTMQRFPDGIEADGFFQKNVPDHFPDWIERAEVPKEGGTVTHAVVTEAATLVYLADQGCITPHLALARTGALRKPDRMVFDLDPSDNDFGKVQEAARAVKAALDRRPCPASWRQPARADCTSCCRSMPRSRSTGCGPLPARWPRRSPARIQGSPPPNSARPLGATRC